MSRLTLGLEFALGFVLGLEFALGLLGLVNRVKVTVTTCITASIRVKVRNAIELELGQRFRLRY